MLDVAGLVSIVLNAVASLQTQWPRAMLLGISFLVPDVSLSLQGGGEAALQAEVTGYGVWQQVKGDQNGRFITTLGTRIFLSLNMYLCISPNVSSLLHRHSPSEAPVAPDPVKTSGERVERLKVLVQLRKLYRNLLRAERLLSTSSPVHQKPLETKPSKGGACLPWLS